MNNKKSIQIMYAVFIIIIAVSYLFLYKNVTKLSLFGIEFLNAKAGLALAAVTVPVVFASAAVAGLRSVRTEEKFLILYVLFGVILMLFLPLNTSVPAIDIRYIHQLAGVYIAGFFTSDVTVLCRSGQISGFVIIALLLYGAINLLPFKKNALLFTACTPVFLYMALRLGSDCLGVTLFIFELSLLLYISCLSESVHFIHILLLYAVSVCLVLCNAVFLPFVFTVLLIPKSRYSGKGAYYITNFLLLALCVLLCILFTPLFKFGDGCIYPALRQPAAFLKLACSALASNRTRLLFGTVGSAESLNIGPLPAIIYAAASVAAVLTETRNKPFIKWGAALIAAAFVSVLLVCVCGYSVQRGSVSVYGFDVIFVPFVLLTVLNIRDIRIDAATVNMLAMPFIALIIMLAVY